MRVRIVSFAFFLDGSISKAADRGTQTFECIVPETQGFPQGCVPTLLPLHRMSSEQAEESQRFPSPREPCGVFAAPSKHANGSALMLPAHRANLELLSV